MENRMYLAMDTWTRKCAENYARQFNHVYCSGECIDGIYRCGDIGITQARVVEVRYE